MQDMFSKACALLCTLEFHNKTHRQSMSVLLRVFSFKSSCNFTPLVCADLCRLEDFSFGHQRESLTKALKKNIFHNNKLV